MPVQPPIVPRPAAGRLHVSHGWRVGIRALCASLSLLVLVGSGIAWATFKKFSANVPHGAAVPALTTNEQDPDGSSQNILLIGNDTRAGASPAELKALHGGHDTSTVNADTMMVLHLPADGGSPSLVSFPRDSWVSIPGHGKSKINAAYPDGYNAAKSAGKSELAAQSAGIALTIRTIHQLTGLHIDHYMQVNLLGFYRISEAIGGVTVCLKHAQNKHTDADEYGSGYSGINLPKGVSVIKGEQALAFVRQRHGLPHGDLDRIKRQQYFLRAAFNKITSAGTLLNPFKLKDLLDAVSSSLLTDPDLDLLSLARQFESLTSGKIEVATIPNNGPQMIYPNGVATSIVEVDKAAMPAFINHLEGKDADAYQDAKPAAPAAVTVDVRNATTISGLAGRNAEALKKSGFKINEIGNADSSGKATSIEYPAGDESKAKALAGVVPHAKVRASGGVTRVTLILGSDRHWVRGVSGAAKADTSRSGSSPATPPKNAATKSEQKSDPTHGLGCID